MKQKPGKVVVVVVGTGVVVTVVSGTVVVFVFFLSISNYENRKKRGFVLQNEVLYFSFIFLNIPSPNVCH